MKDFGIYTANGEAIGTVSAKTAAEAVEIFKAEGTENYGEGLWAEELNS